MYVFPLQVMFETFSASSVYIALSHVLSLLHAGLKTGVVINLGAGMCDTVPIYENHALQHAIFRPGVSGRDLDDYLVKLMSYRGYDMGTRAERMIVKDIKEKLCYVAPSDFDKEETVAENVKEDFYELPEGQLFMLGAERFRCPELLFKPSELYPEQAGRGIHHNIRSTIQRCDKDIHEELYANIVISGGSSVFPGLGERLRKEIADLAPKGTTVNVIAPPDRKQSAFFGGVMLALDPDFNSMSISQKEYNEFGPTIVHRKCF